jgi:hypothetical protein
VPRSTSNRFGWSEPLDESTVTKTLTKGLLILSLAMKEDSFVSEGSSVSEDSSVSKNLFATCLSKGGLG